MKKKRYYTYSYTLLYLLLIIIVCVAGLFYGVGYNNPIDKVNYPMNTDALLFLVYGMIGLSLAVTVWAIVNQFIHVWRQNRKRAYRLLWGITLFLVLILLALLCTSTEAVEIGGHLYNQVLWLRVTEMLLYTIYVLLFFSVLCVILSVTGFFRRIHIKR